MEDILEEWKSQFEGTCKSRISQYKNAIKYRNWLAHGKYWIYKGQQYDPFDIMNIVDDLLKCFKIIND